MALDISRKASSFASTLMQGRNTKAREADKKIHDKKVEI